MWLCNDRAFVNKEYKGRKGNKNFIKQPSNIVCHFSQQKCINFTMAIYDHFYYADTKFRFIFITRVAQHGHHRQQMWMYYGFESIPMVPQSFSENIYVNKRYIECSIWFSLFFFLHFSTRLRSFINWLSIQSVFKNYWFSCCRLMGMFVFVCVSYCTQLRQSDSRSHYGGCITFLVSDNVFYGIQ